MKTITLKELNCCNCGTTFSMDETIAALRKDDGKEFWCPNGHAQYFTTSKQKILDKVAKELAETKEELQEAKVEIRRLKCELLTKPAHAPPKGHALWDQ